MPSHILPTHFTVTGIGTLYLADFSARWVEDIIPIDRRAVINYTQLPNGVIYDHDGDAPAKVIPTTMVLTYNFEGAGANMITEVENWGILVGYKGTLFGSVINDFATDFSCLARLEQREITTPFGFLTEESTAVRLTLTFRPTTNWGPV